MARVTDFEPLYAAFERFLTLCVLGERSLLWPDRVTWTSDNVAEVKRRLIDNPILGAETSFDEKLAQQMDGADPGLWRIIADTYYVYFLPSRNILFDTKWDQIAWAARQAGLTIASKDTDDWKPQSIGILRTSYRYHTKHVQFRLILMFADLVKRADEPTRLLHNADAMQRALDDILASIPSKNDRAYDMRHAILYLTFPDLYERIISSSDKKRIVESFGPRIQGNVPTDIDAALRLIREQLAPEYEARGAKYEYYGELKSEWRDKPAPPAREQRGEPTAVELPDDSDLRAVAAALRHTHNVILYGPPGTGKTYLAGQAAKQLVEAQTHTPLAIETTRQRMAESRPLHELLALSMYLEGARKPYGVIELAQHSLIAARIASRKWPNSSLWAALQTHTSPESKAVSVATRREPYLFDKDAKSRWTLTDAGREFVETSLADSLTDLRSSAQSPASVADFVWWTTFHQSYSYEDFVEGLRPVVSQDEEERLLYDIVPGVFRRVCERAAADRRNNYVLVIDEINRGNIAKIMGELITLIEDDKRYGRDGGLAVRLPYSGNEFSVPDNLYIIGTMNTADRSIALLDAALRRRFAFVEIMPRSDLLNDCMVDSEESQVPLGKLLRNLNESLCAQLDRDHQIGHSYLLRVSRTKPEDRLEMLEHVWNHQIMPLLEEYMYSRPDKLAAMLAPFGSGSSQTEAVDDLAFVPQRLEGEDLLAALSELSRDAPVSADETEPTSA